MAAQARRALVRKVKQDSRVLLGETRATGAPIGVQPAEEHAGPARSGSLRVCPEDNVGSDFERDQPDELAPDSPKVDKS